MDFFEPWIVRRPRRKESPFFELPNTTWPKIVGLLHWLIPKLDCFNIFLTFGLSGRKELFPNNWVAPASFFGNFGFWFFFGGTILTPAFRFFFGGWAIIIVIRSTLSIITTSPCCQDRWNILRLQSKWCCSRWHRFQGFQNLGRETGQSWRAREKIVRLGYGIVLLDR